jgi:hypothetical protein
MMTKQSCIAARLAVLVALSALAATSWLVTGCGSAGGDDGATTTLAGSSAQATGLYPVVTAVGLSGYMDKTGKLVISAQYAEAAPFSEDLAAVRLQAYGPWGYIDKTGKMAIEPQFFEASPFSEGLAAVRVEDKGAWGFVNATGAVVIAPQFASAHEFSEGLACVHTDQESGYVDATGVWVVRMSTYEAVGEFSGGLALVYDRATSLYGFIDKKGGVAVPPTYADAWSFSEDVAAVRLPTGPQLYGFVDKHGEWVVQPQFADARPFSEGLAAVQSATDGAWGYVDVTGTAVIGWNWDEAEPFTLGVARVGRIVSGTDAAGRVNWGYAYIDMGGKVLWRDQALVAFESGSTTTTVDQTSTTAVGATTTTSAP